MKAFLIALLVIAGLSIGANLLLQEAQYSSAEVFKTENVRLGD